MLWARSCVVDLYDKTCSLVPSTCLALPFSRLHNDITIVTLLHVYRLAPSYPCPIGILASASTRITCHAGSHLVRVKSKNIWVVQIHTRTHTYIKLHANTPLRPCCPDKQNIRKRTNPNRLMPIPNPQTVKAFLPRICGKSYHNPCLVHEAAANTPPPSQEQEIPNISTSNTSHIIHQPQRADEAAVEPTAKKKTRKNKKTR